MSRAALPSNPASTDPTNSAEVDRRNRSSIWDYLFRATQIANALGNSGVAAMVASTKNPALFSAALVTSGINSYAAGEARDNANIQNVSRKLWWTDRFLSFIAGLNCGATTAVSSYEMFNSLLTYVGSVNGLIVLGLLLGLLVFIATYRNLRDKYKTWGLFFALLLSLGVAGLFIGISFAVINLAGVAFLPGILVFSTLFLSAAIGLSSLILNYGITINSFIRLFVVAPPKEATTEPTPITEITTTEDNALEGEANTDSEGETNELLKGSTEVKKAPAYFNSYMYYGLSFLAALCCFASSCAILGLAYISIMALPAAFSFTAPTALMLFFAISISVISGVATFPLIYKQCEPIINQWSSIRPADMPKAIYDTLKKYYVFNPEIYVDTRKNRFKFYLRATLITLIVPIAIIGTVLTMMQAMGDFAKVITQFINIFPVATRDVQTTSSVIASTLLGLALVSDATFALTTGADAVKSGFDFAQAKIPEANPGIALEQIGTSTTPATIPSNPNPNPVELDDDPRGLVNSAQRKQTPHPIEKLVPVIVNQGVWESAKVPGLYNNQAESENKKGEIGGAISPVLMAH